MKCLHCNSKDFETKKIRFKPKLKGETLDVLSPAYVCTNCGESLMDSKQADGLRNAAADKYRKNHNLQTSKEIIAIRKKFAMSQLEFAKYLKVGEASIKRWETYYIQDASQNEHIRLKTNEFSATLNLLNVYWKNQKEDIYSGNRKFSFDLFSNLVLSLVKVCKTPLYINKALFYADFLHFKNFKVSLTGSKYIRLEHGPCPDKFREIFQLMLEKKMIKEDRGHNLIPNKKINKSIFDDREIETIKKVINFIKEKGLNGIYKSSHEEKAYKKSIFLQTLSYKYASDLKLK